MSRRSNMPTRDGYILSALNELNEQYDTCPSQASPPFDKGATGTLRTGDAKPCDYCLPPNVCASGDPILPSGCTLV